MAVKYAHLPESSGLQEKLAMSIGLKQGAGYCEIAERFLEIVDSFLTDVQKRNSLSRVGRHNFADLSGRRSLN